ncbi:MAG: hypothetical protein LC126_19000 [Bryobacterales bacterium]|nr:hypothetical protein [Bryobacterales bacterium]
MRTIPGIAVVLLTLAGAAFGQAKKAAKPKSPPASSAATPKWKAIWEPVPFTKDIELQAISCVGPETCWIAGRKSTILFTSNGGKTWETQLGGDSEATDEDLAGTRKGFDDFADGRVRRPDREGLGYGGCAAPRTGAPSHDRAALMIPSARPAKVK